MTTAKTIAARLADLHARSETSDRAAQVALTDLQAAGQQLADAMGAMADTLEEVAS